MSVFVILVTNIPKMLTTSRLCYYQLIIKRFHQKLKCEMIAECVAYTFEQSKLNCILHSSIGKGRKYARGKQTGSKKPDFILSLPEINYCSEENRQRRCRDEPKCEHVDCLRNAPEILLR